MDGLADMYEGWAQSDRTDSVNVARLLGWADGLRALAATVGADYAPPEAFPGAPVSLLTVDLLDEEDIARVGVAEKPKQLGTGEHCAAFVLDIPGGDRQAALGGESLQLIPGAVGVLIGS
jgi:hypothetical protein